MISRRNEIGKEILLSLAYPALLSFFVCCFLSMGGEPVADDPASNASVMPVALAIALATLGLASLIGVFVLAALDWDMYHDFHPVVNFLLIFVRIGSVCLFFLPFLFLWDLIIGGIFLIFS